MADRSYLLALDGSEDQDTDRVLYERFNRQDRESLKEARAVAKAIELLFPRISVDVLTVKRVGANGRIKQ